MKVQDARSPFTSSLKAAMHCGRTMWYEISAILREIGKYT